MCRSVCAFALAGALSITAPAAAAGPAWLEPTSLSAGTASPAGVALAAPGDAVAVWTRAGAVEARVRTPGSGYGAAAPLGNPGAAAPDVDMAPDGTAVAAWAQGQSVAYAVRPPGGAFGPTQLLRADAGSGEVTAVRVLVSRSGDALLAYVRGRAFAAVRPAGGTPGDTAELSAGPACDLGAAEGAGGRAAVVWRDCGPGATTIRSARRSAAAFSTSEVASGTSPVVAVDAHGSTVVAWEMAGDIRAAVAPPDAGFGPPRTISDGAAGTPSLTATADGIWAAWRAIPASRVMASSRPTGQEFGPGAPVSGDGVAPVAPALAGGGDGSVLVAWVREADEYFRVEAARRAPGTPFFAASGLVSAAAPETGALELDADDDGNALAAYLRGGVPTVQTLDAAGPRFTSVTVREAGHALDVYPFAVEAADAWSAVAATAFDFGDGTGAPGPRAEHAFPSQGEWTVTVGATDALGNRSATTRRFLAGPPLDRTAPVLTKVRMDVTRFRRSTKETAVVAAARKRRRGTRFRYTLSEPAQVNIFFERVVMGRRRGKLCIRGNRRGRKCRVYEPAGLITRSHKTAGPVSTAFSGRIVGRSGPLKVVDVFFEPGRYRATIVASDATRNIGKPAQLAFTLLR